MAWLVRRGAGHRGAPPSLSLAALFVLLGLVSRGMEFTLRSPADESRFMVPTSFLDLFGIGMFVAWAEHAVGAAIARSRTSNLRYALAYPFAACFGAGCLVLAIVGSPPGQKIPFLSFRPLVAVGGISYSVYLYHTGVELAFLAFLPRRYVPYVTSHHWFFAFTVLPLILVASAVAYYLVELPTMRWGSKRSKFTLRKPAVDLQPESMR